MRIFITLLLLLHGLINLLGFLKSLKPAWVAQLKENISALHGLLWLTAALLFILAALACITGKYHWWIIALPALVMSQAMVARYWQDAKFGTIANILLLAFAFIAFSGWRFKSAYEADINASFQHQPPVATAITEKDLGSLPAVIRKYLEYTGHKNIVTHFHAVLEGKIRSGPDAAWMRFTADQYSWTADPSRYFFMNATMKGLPVTGYHRFKNTHASMDIRLLSLFPVSRLTGTEMDIAETVTHLNDMCLLAPGSLLDKRIEWIRADDREAELVFNNNGIRVKAILQFNNNGQLVNFISDDRYMVGKDQTMIKARWSTPVNAYREKGGIRFPSSGEAIWETGGTSYAYAKMNILSVSINPSVSR